MEKAIRVLYEDEHLLIFCKPAGLLVIPSPQKEKNTLAEIVNRQHPNLKTGRLHPCHRLDRETSGIIIFAKGKRVQQMMMAVFHRQAVSKTYVAFVRGQLKQGSGRIQSCIQDHYAARFNKARHQTGRGEARNAGGKMAITDYRVMSVKPDFSVVEIFPRTGRTNQIRIHFREIGHPLLGERIYAFGKDFPVKFRRLALHAGKISFRHPVTGKMIEVESELPEDMKAFLNRSWA